MQNLKTTQSQAANQAATKQIDTGGPSQTKSFSAKSGKMDIKTASVKSTLDKQMIEEMKEASKQIQKKIASENQMLKLIQGIEIFINKPSLMDEKEPADLMNKIVTDSMEKLVSIAPGRKDVSSILHFMHTLLTLAILIKLH